VSNDESGDTIVEALRRANPVPAGAGVSRRSLPSAHALFADVISRRTRAVRRRVLLVAIAIALLALLLLGFAALRRQGTSLSIAPVCFGSDSVHGPKVVAAGGDPEQACATVWAGGRFGATAAPDFDVCVLPSGVLGVFPGESGSVCPRLDLPESSGDDRVERFVDSIDAQVSGACTGLEQAENIVNTEIAKRQFSGWTIAAPTGGFDAARTCASIAVDPGSRKVSIIGILNPFPGSDEQP